MLSSPAQVMKRKTIYNRRKTSFKLLGVKEGILAAKNPDERTFKKVRAILDNKVLMCYEGKNLYMSINFDLF
jgi:hypothetical protein